MTAFYSAGSKFYLQVTRLVPVRHTKQSVRAEQIEVQYQQPILLATCTTPNGIYRMEDLQKDLEAVLGLQKKHGDSIAEKQIRIAVNGQQPNNNRTGCTVTG